MEKIIEYIEYANLQRAAKEIKKFNMKSGSLWLFEVRDLHNNLEGESLAEKRLVLAEKMLDWVYFKLKKNEGKKNKEG